VRENVCKIFQQLLPLCNDGALQKIAASLRNLSVPKECRELLVAQGAIDVVVRLAAESNAQTRQSCADTLGYLSENTSLNPGTVSSLLNALKVQREEETDQRKIPILAHSGGHSYYCFRASSTR
jgi:hypothetical protein